MMRRSIRERPPNALFGAGPIYSSSLGFWCVTVPSAFGVGALQILLQGSGNLVLPLAGAFGGMGLCVLLFQNLFRVRMDAEGVEVTAFSARWWLGVFGTTSWASVRGSDLRICSCDNPCHLDCELDAESISPPSASAGASDPSFRPSLVPSGQNGRDRLRGAGPARPMSPAQVDEAARLYQTGQSPRAIATHFGRHASTIRPALIKAGVPTRDRNGRDPRGRSE
jgi:Helix-turn-helix domain